MSPADFSKKCARCGESKLASQHFTWIMKRGKKVPYSFCKPCALVVRRKSAEKKKQALDPSVDMRTRESREARGIERSNGRELAEKRCSKCRNIMPTEGNFYFSERDGWLTKCIACVRGEIREWSEANPERVRETNLRNQRKNRPKEVHRLNEANRRVTPDGWRLTGPRWRALLEAFGHLCCYCDQKGELSIEHLTPIHRGGTNTPGNVAPSCLPCNKRKWTQTAEEFCPERAIEIRRRALLCEETLLAA